MRHRGAPLLLMQSLLRVAGCGVIHNACPTPPHPITVQYITCSGSLARPVNSNCFAGCSTATDGITGLSPGPGDSRANETPLPDRGESDPIFKIDFVPPPPSRPPPPSPPAPPAALLRRGDTAAAAAAAASVPLLCRPELPLSSSAAPAPIEALRGRSVVDGAAAATAPAEDDEDDGTATIRLIPSTPIDSLNCACRGCGCGGLCGRERTCVQAVSSMQGKRVIEKFRFFFPPSLLHLRCKRRAEVLKLTTLAFAN